MIVQMVGQTKDGRKVVGGLFYAHDTLGVSLGVSVALLEGLGMVPDLHGFILDARKSGWSADSIRQRVREAIVDTHGIDYWGTLQSRVNRSLFEPVKESA